MYQAAQNRYQVIPYRRCGASGLMLPAVSLGLWHNFGDTAPYENMRALCRTAFDHGITHFDLANNYGPEPGQAEKNCGLLLAKYFKHHRDELVISTKAGYEMWTGPYGDLGSRKYLLASLDQSLERLGLDYVDIFYHHHPDPETPLEETMGALAQAVNSGKALYVGLSNYDGPTMEKAAAILAELHVPFIINQNRYNEAMSYKQNDAERMIQRAEGNKTGTSTVTPEERYHALCTIYNFYSPNMCQRFGTARVMSAYGYSDQVTDITATRHRKIVFCEMLLDEQPFTSRLFGMELGRMAFDGEIYDVENDFHGICFLYGWVGLAMMVAFIGYFLYLIVKCLIKDFRKYFTVEAGAFGIGLCLCLVYAYFTAGVLRRPNASIYMSVLLAVVYYLTQMRSEQPDALPDGEEKRA